MGLNCLKATEPLLGDSLIFTIQSTGTSNTHLIDLIWLKALTTRPLLHKFEILINLQSNIVPYCILVYLTDTEIAALNLVGDTKDSTNSCSCTNCV